MMKIYKGIIQKDFVENPLVGKISRRDSYEDEIVFATPFSQVPHVQICIERIDTGGFIEPSPFIQNGQRIHQTVTRYDAVVCNVSESGFSLKISTWGASVIYGFRISWMAIGSIKEPIELDRPLTIRELLDSYQKIGAPKRKGKGSRQ